MRPPHRTTVRRRSKRAIAALGLVGACAAGWLVHSASGDTAAPMAGTAGNRSASTATVETALERVLSAGPDDATVGCVVAMIDDGSLDGSLLQRLANGERLTVDQAATIATAAAGCVDADVLRVAAGAALDGPLAPLADACLTDLLAGLDPDELALVLAATMTTSSLAQAQLDDVAGRCTTTR